MSFIGMPAVLTALITTVPTMVRGQIAYQQSFTFEGANPFPDLSTPDGVAAYRDEFGWCGGNTADVFCVALEEGEGRIGNNARSAQEEAAGSGFAFVSQTGINAALFAYTNPDTFTCATNALTTLSWVQADANNNEAQDARRVAFYVQPAGDDAEPVWYVSEETFFAGGLSFNAPYVEQSIDLTTATFLTVSPNTAGDNLPEVDIDMAMPSIVGLPSDSTVLSFGFVWPNSGNTPSGTTKSSTSRWDDVVLEGIPNGAGGVNCGLVCTDPAPLGETVELRDGCALSFLENIAVTTNDAGCTIQDYVNQCETMANMITDESIDVDQYYECCIEELFAELVDLNVISDSVIDAKSKSGKSKGSKKMNRRSLRKGKKKKGKSTSSDGGVDLEQCFEGSNGSRRELRKGKKKMSGSKKTKSSKKDEMDMEEDVCEGFMFDFSLGEEALTEAPSPSPPSPKSDKKSSSPKRGMMSKKKSSS